ncbi:hypothetical protein AB0O51_36985 [Streptomyces sp. NPDC090301]|uniref:hypothetical protein n=1 Tax=Streptomyces sp. NPDC090301 TaxID=3154975 RepID=UPI00343E03C6
MSELRGRSEEANALAVWLRKVTADVSVRVLAETFPYSKSVWSEYRNGAKLIPMQLLNDVVDTLVSDEVRESQRADGLRLLEAAQKAARRNASRQVPRVSPDLPDRASMLAGVSEILLRLDDARRQQIQVMRQLADSEQRCRQLQEMVSVLHLEYAQLTAERGHARVEAYGLEAALEQAQGLLRHARRAAEQAFELRLAAEARVARVQADARRATGIDLSPLERLDEVLQAAQDQLAEEDHRLNALRSDLGLSGQPAAESAASQVITGQVLARYDGPHHQDSESVHGDPEKLADNTVTSMDAVPLTRLSMIVRTMSKALSPASLRRAVRDLWGRAGFDKRSAPAGER